MNDPLNMLQKYMDFYRNSGVSHDYSAHNGFNPTPYNPQGEALDFAVRMMNQGGSQQVPDFFGAGNPAGQGGYTPGEYVQPQRAPAQQMPAYAPRNFLAQVLGRR